MVKRSTIAVVAAGLAVSACQHAPVNLGGCNLAPIPLTVAEPGTRTLAPQNDFATLVAQSLAVKLPDRAGLAPGATAAHPALLLLSGGSERGAFGAGYLDSWKQNGGLPAFQIVTGISTGALLGTLAFTGDTEKAVQGYTINAESDLLAVTSRDRIGQLRAGSIGNLDPLRTRIDGLLDDVQLTRIADAGVATPPRHFYVGVVNARSGEASAIDMTAIARQWRDNPDRRAQLKRCYVEVLIASSSVPLAAPPVYIDGEQYIDGGARFGMFYLAADQALAQAKAQNARAKAPAPVGFLILNGQLEIEPQCRFVAAQGPDGNDYCPADSRLRDWDILELGLRSVDILTNQIYRFSADYAARQVGSPTHFTRIYSDVSVFPATIDGQTLTCSQWHARDMQAQPAPVQFHPDEMKCLIAYGRDRAKIEQWWTFQ